ncbi:hypothetical protein PTI98_010490 [Pleurotus ostreatus]|nr:hypothetical protein PTI98_010490 [Pleurotus ostreatus]
MKERGKERGGRGRDRGNRRKWECPLTRVLTSQKGIELARQKEAEQREKQQAKDAAREARAAKENEEEQHRVSRDPNEPFYGSLSSKNKSDLKDVAHALKLSKEGTKEVLLKRIQDHFDDHPHLRVDQRFHGLFNRGRPRASEPNPAPPSFEPNPPPLTPQPLRLAPFALHPTLALYNINGHNIQYQGNDVHNSYLTVHDVHPRLPYIIHPPTFNPLATSSYTVNI